jgi:hypothetical protein
MDAYESMLVKIKHVIEETGMKATSEWRLHQLIYLAQLFGEDFDQYYKCSVNGVHSKNLARDLDYAVVIGLLKREDDKSLVAVIQNDNSSENGDGALSEQTKACLERLAKRRDHLLGALTTLLYLAQDSYSGKELERKFYEIRPDLSHIYEEVYNEAKKCFSLE